MVLTAAFCHAYWNFLLKRTGGGPGLLTAVALVSLAWLLPVALVWCFWTGYRPNAVAWGAMLVSGLIHGAYFLMLDRAYRGRKGDAASAGDLSVVYPLARATGPLLTIIMAVIWLGERPSS
jgi:drug/metabolite transporter (DMT)-like permease